MASIATCPQCAKQLAVPESATSADHAECPLCGATFSLANVVQLAIPPARIICMSAESTESASTIQDSKADEDNTSKTVTTSDTSTVESTPDSLPSWEARLKRAIEADTSELTSDTKAEEDRVESKNEPPTTPPQFDEPDFEFDLPDAEEKIPTAEFSDSTISQQQDSLDTEVENPSHSNELFDADLGAPESNDTHAAVASTDDHAALVAKLQINARQRSEPRSWLKVAILLVSTSLIGTFLGLYALIWIGGPSADFVGLANVLPKSMLPATSSISPNTSLAESNSSLLTSKQELPAEDQQSPTKDVATEVDLPEETPVVESIPPLPIHQDEAVQPASSDLPPEPLSQTTSNQLEEFINLTLGAKDALPQFFAGDFSTRESIASKGQAYIALCQLAEQFEFTLQPNPDQSTLAEIELAQAIFGELFSNIEAEGDLAKIVSRWWEHGRRSNQGILLSGVVQEAQPVGNGTLCSIVPGGQESLAAIPVLIDQPSVAVGSRVGVVGRIANSEDPLLAQLGLNLAQAVFSLQTYDLP